MIVKSVEKKEKNTLSFQVEVSKEEFDSALDTVYQKNKKDITVPGFRRGKAPRVVAESVYGAEIFYEDAINDLSGQAYGFAVREESLKVVGRPSVSDVDISEDKVVTLSFDAALYPEPTLGEYKNLEAPKASVEVTGEDVEKELEDVMKRNARIVTVDRPAAEFDTVIIDFNGFLDGEPFEGGQGEGQSLMLGSGQFVPGFEEQLIGMSAGEEKDIDITFPEEYHEELAGKTVVFHVKVHEVKETELPIVDDEFAKDVSEFDTLDEYKADIRENLRKTREASAEEDFKKALMDKAISNMTVEIPDAMIEERQEMVVRDYAQNLAGQGYTLEQYLSMMGIDQNMFFASTRPSAIAQIQSELLLDEVAKAEDFQLSDEEIEAEYKKAAEAYNADLEMVKNAVPPEMIKTDLLMKKAADLILETGIPTEPAPEGEAEEEVGDEPDTAETEGGDAGDQAE